VCLEGRPVPRGRWHCNDFRSEHRIPPLSLSRPRDVTAPAPSPFPVRSFLARRVSVVAGADAGLDQERYFRAARGFNGTHTVEALRTPGASRGKPWLSFQRLPVGWRVPRYRVPPWGCAPKISGIRHVFACRQVRAPFGAPLRNCVVAFVSVSLSALSDGSKLRKSRSRSWRNLAGVGSVALRRCSPLVSTASRGMRRTALLAGA